jgi:hypothetical protein
LPVPWDSPLLVEISLPVLGRENRERISVSNICSND